MKLILEEYGRTIIVVVAVVIVFALLFVRLDFIGVISSVADVNSGVSHQQGADALKDVVEMEKPKVDFDDVERHLYINQALQPLKGAVFTDAALQTIDATVTSIVYYDAEQKPTELIGYYNATKGFIVVNPAHYSDSHTQCTEAEVKADASGRLIFAEESVKNCPGYVTVTYAAKDDENQVTVAQLTFVIDSKTAQTSYVANAGLPMFNLLTIPTA